MRIHPFSKGFGAQVTDIDLSESCLIKPGMVKTIEAALTKFKVLKFDGQHLTPDMLVSIGSKFGDFAEDPFIEPVSLDTPVIEIKRAKDESTPIFGGDWHSDWSFQAKPPRFTFLYGHVVPPKGGRTVFADCVRAHESLPEVTKAKVTGLQAIHSARRAYGPFGLFAKDDSSRSMRIKVSGSAEKTITHPIVRFIKELGEGAIFVNPVYTVGIKGLSSQESANLLKDLSEHITDEAFQLPISWSPGTLVIWDNRTVVHFAEGGYEGYERVMLRMTIGKERPMSPSHSNLKK